MLVHCSRMEGGAHGRQGRELGADYPGYFEWNDAQGLAALLAQCRTSQSDPQRLLASLGRFGHARGPLFSPEAELQKVRALLQDLLGGER